MDNYPDTTYEADPEAPWNQADPWFGHRCNECVYFYGIPSEVCKTKVGFCTDYPCYLDGEDEACEWFEE